MSFYQAPNQRILLRPVPKSGRPSHNWLTTVPTLANFSKIGRHIFQTSKPDEWGIGKSDSGWMKADTFYEYMMNVFEPWLRQITDLPVLFFVDGHSSHNYVIGA